MRSRNVERVVGSAEFPLTDSVSAEPDTISESFKSNIEHETVAELVSFSGKDGSSLGAREGASSHDSDSARTARASYASTIDRPTSEVPSIFSVTHLGNLSRLSTVSSAYTRDSMRQSSLDSDPPSAISPLSPEKRKDSLPSHRYCCTFCEESFELKSDWEHHQKLHSERGIFVCPDCQLIFPESLLLASHRKSAHLDARPSDVDSASLLAKFRGAWGCGFCEAFIQSNADYLEHVGRHHDDGLGRAQWQHSRVIRGLLQQPKLQVSWNALVKKEEATQGAKLRFVWDPATTGRYPYSNDSAGTGLLQDLLEYCPSCSVEPETVVRVAFDQAQVRREENVTDLLKGSKFVLNPNINPRSRYLDEALAEHPKAPNDLGSSPTDPLESYFTANAKTDPSLPSSRSSSSLTASFSARMKDKSSGPFESSSKSSAKLQEGQPSPVPAVSVTPNMNDTATVRSVSGLSHHIGPLRRTDSDRNLVFSRPNSDEKIRIDGNNLPRTVSGTRSKDTGMDQVASTRSPSGHSQPSLMDALLELSPENNAVRKDWLVVGQPRVSIPLMSHSGSSIVSGQTMDHSPSFDDGASDRVSDDSCSEPDAWFGLDDHQHVTPAWSQAYQQAIERVMERLWTQYNRDWRALINACAGSSSNSSPHGRDVHRVRKGTSPRHAAGRGIRPGIRPPGDDDDDDDDMEGNQPATSQTRSGPGIPKRFACPFRKRDPHTFNLRDHEICTVKDWPTIPRLK